MTAQTDIVVDQFTRQATPFANAAAMRDEEALRLLVEFSGAGAADTVLDVACGPGLVVAAFAKVCRSAVKSAVWWFFRGGGRSPRHRIMADMRRPHGNPGQRRAGFFHA